MKARVDELTYKQSRQEKQLTDTQTRAHGAENDLRNLQDHLRNKDLEIKVRVVWLGTLMSDW